MHPIVTTISVVTVNLPLQRSIVSAVGHYDKWPFIITEITLDNGVVGNSYICPYLLNYTQPIEFVIRELSGFVKNKPLAPADFYEIGLHQISLLGRSGIAMYALAALDIAMWDASAKDADLPLCEHLGGDLADVKAYNSGGLWLLPPEKLAKQAAELRHEGNFSALKIRLGRDNLDTDLKAIEAVRSQMDEEGHLLCDFNQVLTFNAAIPRLKALDQEGLYWFEEPIPYYELQNYAALRRVISTPLILGENFHGVDHATQSLEIGSGDAIMPDLMRIGGISGWIKTAALAEAYKKPVSSHLYHEVSAHLMRVTPTADYLEWMNWSDPLFKEPYQVKDGHLKIPERPGVGLELNREIIELYRVR
ncbi:MAG TPA: mandelate racemase [Gammaproteobacteria bacterium]|nr:mandelate racemase [Gammaproteobacteria bacterium]